MTVANSISEVVTSTVVAVQSAAAYLILSVTPAGKMEALEWSILPIIGATVAAGGAFCFNTQQEVRRVVIGRCLFALIIGVVVPRGLSMWSDWVMEILNDPLLKVGAGFIFGLGAYILSWPVVKRFYERAPVIAAQQIKRMETTITEHTMVEREDVAPSHPSVRGVKKRKPSANE